MERSLDNWNKDQEFDRKWEEKRKDRKQELEIKQKKKKEKVWNPGDKAWMQKNDWSFDDYTAVTIIKKIFLLDWYKVSDGAGHTWWANCFELYEVKDE